MHRLLIVVLLGVAGCASPEATGPPPADPEAVEVLVLGTYHFANPGRDAVQHEVPDILSPSKQAEVEEVVGLLEQFAPTVVAVEVRSSQQARLDSLYDAFRAGTHDLSRSETQQIGFRLADRRGLARVHGVDYGLSLPWSDYNAALDSLAPQRRAEVDALIEQITAEDDSLLRSLSLRDLLRADNDPQKIARLHDGFYLRSLTVGAGAGFEGADYVTTWYERNLKIFANLAAASGPGDRVVLIVGSGHAAILRDLVRQASWMRLVEPRAVL